VLFAFHESLAESTSSKTENISGEFCREILVNTFEQRKMPLLKRGSINGNDS